MSQRLSQEYRDNFMSAWRQAPRGKKAAALGAMYGISPTLAHSRANAWGAPSRGLCEGPGCFEPLGPRQRHYHSTACRANAQLKPKSKVNLPNDLSEWVTREVKKLGPSGTRSGLALKLQAQRVKVNAVTLHHWERRGKGRGLQGRIAEPTYLALRAKGIMPELPAELVYSSAARSKDGQGRHDHLSKPRSQNAAGRARHVAAIKRKTEARAARTALPNSAKPFRLDNQGRRRLPLVSPGRQRGAFDRMAQGWSWDDRRSRATLPWVNAKRWLSRRRLWRYKARRYSALLAAAARGPMSVAELAGKVGVTADHLTKVLSGSHRLSETLKGRLAACLGLSEAELFGTPGDDGQETEDERKVWAQECAVATGLTVDMVAAEWGRAKPPVRRHRKPTELGEDDRRLMGLYEAASAGGTRVSWKHLAKEYYGKAVEDDKARLLRYKTLPVRKLATKTIPRASRGRLSSPRSV